MKSFVDLSYFLGLPAVTGENGNAWPPNLTSTVIMVFQLQHLRSYCWIGKDMFNSFMVGSVKDGGEHHMQ